MSTVTGQLSSTPSSPRVVEENSFQDAPSLLREEQPSNKDVLPEEPMQSTDTETKGDIIMDETKVFDDKETDNQDLDQGDDSFQTSCQTSLSCQLMLGAGTSNMEQPNDAPQVQAKVDEDSAELVAAAEPDAAGLAASADKNSSSVASLENAESRQPASSDVVESGVSLADKDVPPPRVEEMTKSDVGQIEVKKVEAAVLPRAQERDSEKTFSSASCELEQQLAPQDVADLDDGKSAEQQGEVEQSFQAGQIVQSRLLSPEKYNIPLATPLPRLTLHGTQSLRQIVEYGLEWPLDAEPIGGSSNQSFKEYLGLLENHMNKVRFPPRVIVWHIVFCVSLHAFIRTSDAPFVSCRPQLLFTKTLLRRRWSS